MSETKFTRIPGYPGYAASHEMKATPGPWRTSKPGYVCATNGDDRFYGIAVTLGKSDREDEANAHLITAAPDLYEALECARDHYQLSLVGHLSDEFHAICDRWRARVEEVVGQDYPASERYPGWISMGMTALSIVLCERALAKARGEVTP